MLVSLLGLLFYYYSAFRRRLKKKVWPDQAVDDLLNGVNLYGVGKWSKVITAFSFPENFNNVKLKDKWRNLIKYNHVKCCDGKYILK